MTNIDALPLYRATLGISTDEDLNFALAFTLSDGVTPLPLEGIAFAMTVGSSAILTNEAGGGLTISGASNNILSAFWPAASSAIQPGVYSLGLAASDGAYTRDVFQERSSTVTIAWGASSPIQLRQIPPQLATLVSSANPQLVANMLSITALDAQVAELRAAVAALQAGGGTGGGASGGSGGVRIGTNLTIGSSEL